jgi:hypothetical protein
LIRRFRARLFPARKGARAFRKEVVDLIFI